MIDWNRVEELRREIGEGGFAEVLDLFWDEVESILDRLSNQSAPQLEADLHFLKGSAWNLGFTGFGAHCQHGEKMAAQGLAADVDPELVTRQYRITKHAFLAGLEPSGQIGNRVA